MNEWALVDRMTNEIVDERTWVLFDRMMNKIVGERGNEILLIE